MKGSWNKKSLYELEEINRVILATKNVDNKYDANNKKEQVEDNGDNNPKPMSKNARKKERRRAERRAMMATKVISE